MAYLTEDAGDDNGRSPAQAVAILTPIDDRTAWTTTAERPDAYFVTVNALPDNKICPDGAAAEYEGLHFFMACHPERPKSA